MTTIIDLELVVINWIKSILPGRVVLKSSGGQGAQPNTDYCVALLGRQEQIGYQSAILSEDGTTETIANTSHIDVIIDLYFGAAKQDAAILRSSLSSSSRHLDLWTVCGLVNECLVEDLTALETGAMRQRARVTFQISANLGWIFDADSFDKTTIIVEREDLDYPIDEITIDSSL